MYNLTSPEAAAQRKPHAHCRQDATLRGFMNVSPRKPQAALRGRLHHYPHYRDVDTEAQKVEALTKGNGTGRGSGRDVRPHRDCRGARERAWQPRGPWLLPGSDPSAPESGCCCCGPLSLQGGYRWSVPRGGCGKSSHAAGSNGAPAILDGKRRFSAA